MRIGISVALVGCVGCTDQGGPHLESVMPDAAARGAQVTLRGEHLCGTPPNCESAGGEVQVGLNPPIALAGILEYTDNGAIITIPTLAEVGPSAIVVTVNDSSSNALDFEVLP